ncbi:MAG: type VI secretion system baseplate subunit TssF [Phycisphaeraceae bacterium]|nr:type VI secretion system baseplate subunit TssF [Phycisphaeraceae bacterium]
MDSRLKNYYERELRHLRETAGEFAEEYPKIAARLGVSKQECADPYVERLLEGVAYLSARIQLKLDAEFPGFTQHLLESVYPQYLAPIPSMAVVAVNPDYDDNALASGYTLSRGTAMRSNIGRGENTPCYYTTAHEVTLWPVQLIEAGYHSRDLGTLDLPRNIPGPQPKAALRLGLKSTAGLSFAETDMDSLDLYLSGSDQTPMRVYEQLLAHATAVVARPPGKPPAWTEVMDALTGAPAGSAPGPDGPKPMIRRVGYQDDEALLPYPHRAFHGYRLLQEYFAFPQRFLFVRLSGLLPLVKKCKGNRLDLIIPLSKEDPALEAAVTAANIRLYCTPAINLFPRVADRIHISDKVHEHHLVVDRTRPLDFEVYEVTGVTGYGSSSGDEVEFRPFYTTRDADRAYGRGAYFTVDRVPRALSARERRHGKRSSYAGSEVYVALVDAANAPFRSDLRQVGVDCLCTNRDLPIDMPIGAGRTDFSLEAGAVVDSVRVVAGPTKPAPSRAEGETAWRLISHLSLNYLSLVDEAPPEGAVAPGRPPQSGAAALRDLLRLYANTAEPAIAKQVEGVSSIKARGIMRRVPTPGPIAFARGLEVTLGFQEENFEGTGIFVLGAVLEQFLAKYVSINSFTETVVASEQRGPVMRWPLRMGTRSTI